MADIARLRIDLAEVTPRVRRRIEVPVTLTLDDLHTAIQIAMGWTDTHLYEFRAGRAVYGVPDPDWGFGGTKILPAKRTRVADLLADNRKTFTYVYNLGDDWQHKVRVEATSAGDPAALYPRLVDGEGRCPPEDVGGPWGYAEFLEAIGDSSHEQHDELLEWCGGSFDPADIEEADTRKVMERFAKHLARRKSRRPAGAAT
jgi:hypothetical protein